MMRIQYETTVHLMLFRKSTYSLPLCFSPPFSPALPPFQSFLHSSPLSVPFLSPFQLFPSFLPSPFQPFPHSNVPFVSAIPHPNVPFVSAISLLLFGSQSFPPLPYPSFPSFRIVLVYLFLSRVESIVYLDFSLALSFQHAYSCLHMWHKYNCVLKRKRVKMSHSYALLFWLWNFNVISQGYCERCV